MAKQRQAIIKDGGRLSNRAQILGGVILIAIGLEIFITGIF